jgi:hypothetical protein
MASLIARGILTSRYRRGIVGGTYIGETIMTIEALTKKAQFDLTLEYVDARAVVEDWLSRCRSLHQQYPHLASVDPEPLTKALIAGSMEFVYSPTGVKVVRA